MAIIKKVSVFIFSCPDLSMTAKYMSVCLSIYLCCGKLLKWVRKPEAMKIKKFNEIIIMRQIKIVESFIQEIVNHSICSFLLSKCWERNFAVTLHVSSTGIDIYCLKKQLEIH